jgi:bifunctional DNase/RNase
MEAFMPTDSKSDPQKTGERKTSRANKMFKPMLVSGLTLDPLTNSPIVILKEVDGDRTLPIWIGLLEATAIASELEGIKFSRPMTHDLLKTIIDRIDIEINKVEVCDLKNNTYYALIHLIHEGKEISIDARPSDALALSLRVDAPIFVDEEVIKKSKQIDLTTDPEDKTEQGKKWQEILERLDPEDFGKYKM